jgi:hypothetical protein
MATASSHKYTAAISNNRQASVQLISLPVSQNELKIRQQAQAAAVPNRKKNSCSD